MSTPTLTPAEAGARGRALSLAARRREEIAAGLAVIAAWPKGQTLSVNDVREQLDAIGFPNRARAGLFTRAVSDGLLIPVFYGGSDDQRTVPSTGHSAHGARVNVYGRTRLPYRSGG
ncbi:hypothetical protein ACQP60_04315 [Isoptericola variabilis]|uniref:hypothetical protein n=1 Tax=Isoptericola variabilis TaxID=139208 RepID=UPI003D2576E7